MEIHELLLKIIEACREVEQGTREQKLAEAERLVREAKRRTEPTIMGNVP